MRRIHARLLLRKQSVWLPFSLDRFKRLLRALAQRLRLNRRGRMSVRRMDRLRRREVYVSLHLLARRGCLYEAMQR